MSKDKIEKLELEISSKSDWTTKALDECFGALAAQDFVNIYELGNLYMDTLDDYEEGIAKLGKLTGLDPTLEFKLSPTYTTTLLGLYDTIGGLIAGDREFRALTPEQQFKRDQVADAFLEAQQEIRKNPELQQKFRDAVRNLPNENP